MFSIRNEKINRAQLSRCAVIDNWSWRMRKENWLRGGHREDYVAAVKPGEQVKDARSTDHEQWIVKVRMVDNARLIDVRADRAQWEKLRESDRVKVNYRVGKYTGTVW